MKQLPNESAPETEQIPLAETLDGIVVFLKQYVVFSKPCHPYIVALWIVHTWVLEAFEFSPYLYVHSPTLRCGKTRLFECMKLLCRKSWHVVSFTVAVMFRKIHRECPTAICDEIDTVFTTRRGDNGIEEIRGVFNAGFERGAIVTRCEKLGNDINDKDYHVFCPKAFGGINNGKLPSIILDRSIKIRMERKLVTEIVRRFRKRDAKLTTDALLPTLERLSADQSVIDTLQCARPVIPDELHDRAEEICEPLLAIAEMAGGKWPSIAREAMVEACADVDDEENVGVALLHSIEDIFRQGGMEAISTRELLNKLIDTETDPRWADWWEKKVDEGQFKGPAADIAKHLKQFNITPRTIRVGETTCKGYKREWFEDAFLHYPSSQTSQSSQPASIKDPQTIERRHTDVTQTSHSSDEVAVTENVTSMLRPCDVLEMPAEADKHKVVTSVTSVTTKTWTDGNTQPSKAAGMDRSHETKFQDGSGIWMIGPNGECVDL